MHGGRFGRTLELVAAVIVTYLSHTLYEKYTKCINSKCEHPRGYGVVNEPMYVPFVLSCRGTYNFRFAEPIRELEDGLSNADGSYGAKMAIRSTQQYKDPLSAVQSA